MAFLYGRAGRLTTKNGGFRPGQAASIGQCVAALLPNEAIVVDEAITASGGFGAHAATAAPHDALGVTGGSIGVGLPLALGAAVACPARRVLALQADGSAMYTLQALWSMARERLPVVVVLYANRAYGIFGTELARLGLAHRAGATRVGPGPLRAAAGPGVRRAAHGPGPPGAIKRY